MEKEGRTLDHLLAEKYNNHEFSNEQVDMFYEVVTSNETYYKVLGLIANNTYHESIDTTRTGIRKIDIMKSIIVPSITLEGKKYKPSNIEMTKAMASNIICLLSGATLIYYKENTKREKFYQLTERGWQICYKLVQNNLITIKMK